MEHNGGGLASEINASGSQTQKQYYYDDNQQNQDGTWPEPRTSIHNYIYYQGHNTQIGEKPSPYEIDYNEGPGKIQELTSINPDGSETLGFSLNESGANADVSHQAAHYLIPNLLAEIGIKNVILHVDEILVVALQDGLKIGQRKNSRGIDVFIKENFRLDNFEKLGLTEAEHVYQIKLLYNIYYYITKKLTPKILQQDSQIVEPLENETVRYEEYHEYLRRLQNKETIKQNTLKKVKEAGTWEISYGPLEGFEEFEFGEIPELTGDYSNEVAVINQLIDRLDDRIKFKGV